MKKCKNQERFSDKKKKKRRKHSRGEPLIAIPNPNSQTLFAIILGALCSHDNSQKSLLIIHCLNLLRRSLLQNLSPPVLSLLPILLNSGCAEIASKSTEIVGAASLLSIEMNEMIASETGIIRGLINLLESSTESVSLAACNAILDLSTTSFGRQQLLWLSAIKKLTVSLIQAPRSLPTVLSLFSNGKDGDICQRIVFNKEDLTIALLDAALILINSCTLKQLQDIPMSISRNLVIQLKKVWETVHKMMLCGASLKYSQEGHLYVSNIRTNDVAESIFRLSIDDPHHDPLHSALSNVNEVKRNIFDFGGTNFQEFVLNYWEASPLLLRGSLRASLMQDTMFSSFTRTFRSKEVVSFLPSVLKNLTSCPPIASDELDVLHFLEEVKNHFGSPIIYQQDIRVVKTHRLEGELHYFLGQSGTFSSQLTQFLLSNEILKCQEAFDEGYTIALRGVEFRFESIAAIADGFASLFGQPSAGVNMYLTPPDSQGLSCHSDDHCVFVCQLIGVKEWTLFPRLSPQLPRLYEDWSNTRVQKQAVSGSQQFLLKEGDVLYIPRGVPHQACTITDQDGSAGSSLHLTLAIEVEPPFEWEGFAHVALECWFKNVRESQHPSSDSMSWSLYLVSVCLLHISIKLIGDLDLIFRKACLVGAISLSSISKGWLNMNQRRTFKYLISKINAESKFLDAVKQLETAVEVHEDVFQRERWLQHLSEEGKTFESHRSSISFIDTLNLFNLCNQHRQIVEAEFFQIKSRFCDEVLFEDVESSYKMLLQRYKNVRKQYSNGMLSLHLNDDMK